MAALEAGRLDTFHRFTWHVAMALQDDAESGIAQHRVWQVITAAGIDFTRQPQPGFSAPAVATLRFYRDQAARLHFPTRAAWADLLRASFEQVESADAGTPDAERFTVFCAAYPWRPPP